MPFLPWALNAARFVLWTMPAHRSIQTALLIKTSEVVAKEWEAAHADLPEGSLRYGIRRKDGGVVDVARYTPWGLFHGCRRRRELHGGDVAVHSAVGGTMKAASGKDPFGRDLKLRPTAENPTGSHEGRLPGIVANTALESVTPYLATVRRLLEDGGTGYADSNVLSPKVKPGSETMSGPRRVFDPFQADLPHLAAGQERERRHPGH